jgi:hypothetical protein
MSVELAKSYRRVTATHQTVLGPNGGFPAEAEIEASVTKAD